MSAALVHHQARLWLTAFVVSALLNVAVLAGIFGLHLFNPVVLATPTPPPPPAETVVTILAQLAAPPAEEAGATPAAPSPKEDPHKEFARTSPLQAEEPPEQPAYIGERNTRATSNADAVAEAPALPSQKGREPDFEGDIETTQSRYQEGEMGPVKPPSAPAMPAMPPPGAPLGSELAANDAEQPPTAPLPEPEPPVEPTPPVETPPALPVPPPPPADTLAQGPSPIDIPVKRPEKPAPDQPPQPQSQVQPPTRPKDSAKTTAKKGEDGPKATPPAVKNDNSFQGNQQKTRILGSISRKGESALDVEDSALGRYQAQLSRAVERQWQLNCVRNRDYITPGMLRVRFVIEPSGKVRSLGFVEEFGVGNIQKGFTLSSIREAAIPAMPADVKKELKGEALEIIYNFIF